MRAIDAIRARVDSARTLPGTLAAGWDAFELIRAVADRCADADDGLFAAFMLAAAAAASGRDAAGLAPAAPGHARGITSGGESSAHAGDVAMAIAALASALGTRLSDAVRAAGDVADREACQSAAGEAARIRVLLAGPG